MKPEKAWICMSCREIFDGRANGFGCPVCDKGPCYPIFPWLNRTMEAIQEAEAFIAERRNLRNDSQSEA